MNGGDVTNQVPGDKSAFKTKRNLALVWGSREQFLDLHRDLVAADHDSALCHRGIIGKDLHRIVLGGVQLDDRAATQPQHLVDRHGCRPKHHGDIEGDVIEGRHVLNFLPKTERRLNCNLATSTWYGYRVVNTRNDLAAGLPAGRGRAPVEWRISEQPVAYEDALRAMDERVAAIADGSASELVWLLEHPPLYTAGTSADAADVLDRRFPVYPTGRGGQMTYHGPGQRVAYVMVDLRQRGPDVRRFVATLEEWLIRSLAAFNVRGERREDRVGVWVRRPDKGPGCEDKIAAIGIRVRHWVTLHGISLNVDPDLSHFSGIVPCGVSQQSFGVTSLSDLELTATMPDVDMALRREFETLFGATADRESDGR